MLGAHLNGSTASTTQLLCFALRGKGTEVQAISSGLANVSTITWQGLIHMSFHIIWWLWKSFSVFGINVKTHLNGSTASTNALQCDLPLKGVTKIRGNFKKLVEKSSGNVVRTHTQAHPQHMKVLKLLLCVWYWCGGPLEWVYSLKNQCTMTMTICCALPPAWEVTRILGKFEMLGWHEQW